MAGLGMVLIIAATMIAIGFLHLNEDNPNWIPWIGIIILGTAIINSI